jgi:hypothetical protein
VDQHQLLVCRQHQHNSPGISELQRRWAVQRRRRRVCGQRPSGRNCDRYVNCDRYADAHIYANAHVYADAYAYADTHIYGYADAEQHCCGEYADADADAHSDLNRNADSHIYA